MRLPLARDLQPRGPRPRADSWGSTQARHGPNTMVRILICNDDGVYSPGILALAELASEFGDVRVVAPAFEQSSMSHAITVVRPLHYQRTTVTTAHARRVFDAFRVDGTPADCVAL